MADNHQVNKMQDEISGCLLGGLEKHILPSHLWSPFGAKNQIAIWRPVRHAAMYRAKSVSPDEFSTPSELHHANSTLISHRSHPTQKGTSKQKAPSYLALQHIVTPSPLLSELAAMCPDSDGRLSKPNLTLNMFGLSIIHWSTW